MKSIFALSVCLLFSGNMFSQFTAEMVNVVQGNERNYKVYSDLENYRYEFEESGDRGVVIVHPTENKTFILMPDKKFVHITSTDGMMSRMNDPWQAYLWFKTAGEEKNEGTTKIMGYDCTTQAVYQSGSKVFTCNFSEKLNFPLTIKSDIDENTYMALSNIKKWKPDESMFEVPGDYLEVDRRLRPIIPEPPPPDKWSVAREAIPFSKTMKRGEKLWFSITAEDYYKLIIQNSSDAPGKLIYHIYKDEKPIDNNEQGPDKYRTYRLFPGEKKNLTKDWEAGYEILLELYEGELQLEVRPE